MISPDKCIGCRTCEIVCSFNKTEKFNPKNAAVSVITYEEAFVSVPVMCMHCEEPLCMKVCTVGAISKKENGSVEIDKKKCIGCKMCIAACPLGNITFNSEEKEMVKCDLCGGEPKCAQLCPSGAIQYKEGTPANITRKKIIAERFKELFGEGDE